MSLYTPQVGEESAEMLRPSDRKRVVEELRRLRTQFPKLQMPNGLLDAYLTPPESPDDCIFAMTTDCVSADLETRITPCQFGGTPDCSNCGCIASAALAAVGRHKLPGGLQVEKLFWGSIRVGKTIRRFRGNSGNRPAVPEPAIDAQT